MTSEKNTTKKSLVYGVGTNDADYTVNPVINGKQKMCNFYQTWSGMLERCYSVNEQIRHPTYLGCSVSLEWHSFMNFRKWMEAQDWKGKQLDKDLLVPGNRCYSKDTCIFVSQSINKIMVGKRLKANGLPCGIRKQSKKYQVRISRNGESNNLGTFLTIERANKVYCMAKAKYIGDVIATEHDEKTRKALFVWEKAYWDAAFQRPSILSVI